MSCLTSVDVNIERMTVAHVGAVMAIDAQSFGECWLATTWHQELSDADRLHLVAVTNQEEGPCDQHVLGHGGLIFLAGMAHFSNLAVDPKYRHQGLATRLLIDLLDRARRHGASAATLEVRAANTRAHRIYSRLGFQPLGITPGYYSKPREDALVMSIRYLAEPEVAERIDRVRAALQ